MYTAIPSEMIAAAAQVVVAFIAAMAGCFACLASSRG
jgi:hypothetical protein